MEYDPVSTPSDVELKFDHWRRVAGAVLAPSGFVLTYWLTAGRLTDQGRPLAAILVAVSVLWVTELLPLPATGLIGAVLCIVLGVADAKTVLAPFADPIVFLFLGSFLLARAMTVHGLDRRLAFAVLSQHWLSRHPQRLLAAVGVVTATISMWVSNTATTAMMLPIALGILHALHGLKHGNGPPPPIDVRTWPYATCMMLMLTYAASIGGVGTPVGSPPNLIGIGLIRDLAGIQISFFRWMSLGVPLLVVMGVIAFGILMMLQPAKSMQMHGLDDLQKYLKHQRELLGGWTWGQTHTLFAFLLAITLWILPGVLNLFVSKDNEWLQLLTTRVPEGVAAILAGTLLFVLPIDLRAGRFTLTWQEATKIDWGTLLLFGAGLSLGTLMFQTGVARSLGEGIADYTGASSLWTLTALAVALSILLSELTSNTAAANMVIPIVIALAQAANVNPVPPALGACLGASFGFALPVSTPPNAIVYGSGLVPMRKMIWAGLLLDVSGFVIIVVGLRVLCPLLGWQ